ncbi:uncharacterized protein LOC107490138 [Arachis duranensis]|uniref:Uncharacterized protein LOC107490138 n=1 Tax=Arachis duranensis TaxID=130453 RepID=A0A6P4DDH2_ARADU|nr:uncharacterized protein LOC107490138 [Arachis duranensis]
MKTPKKSLSDFATIVSDLFKTTHSFMQETQSSIRNLEIQVGQLSSKIPERPFNTLPSNIEVNPREECKALTMRKKAELKKEDAAKDLKEEEAPEETGSALVHASVVMKELEIQDLQNVQKETKDERLAQFLAVFKKLQINIPFAEVLEKMLPYMACLKSVFSEKKALRGYETVVLTKECNALVQKKLPQKSLDPESFLIPCTIRTITFEKVLCDLGSSINLMPLSIMKKLGIQEAQPTRISLKMADKSLKPAYRVVEKVHVKVEDLYLPADFVILDTGEGKDNSNILGRPFLAIGRALIDVEIGEIVLMMHEDYLLFKIPKPQPLSDKGGTRI